MDRVNSTRVSKMLNQWNTVDVYSIEKRDQYEDDGSCLIKRTETPVSLSKAFEVCTNYETQGHVVEIRRVS